jgi:hypothetical protein
VGSSEEHWGQGKGGQGSQESNEEQVNQGRHHHLPFLFPELQSVVNTLPLLRILACFSSRKIILLWGFRMLEKGQSEG